MSTYDSFDSKWQYFGDYQIGLDGDLMDTSTDALLSLIQEVQTVIASEFDDWALDPNVGANLSDYLGEANDRNTGKAIENRLISRVVAIGIVRPEDIKCRVIPVGKNEVMAVLTINATATSLNNLRPGEPLTVTLIYDTVEHEIFFLEVKESTRKGRSF